MTEAVKRGWSFCSQTTRSEARDAADASHEMQRYSVTLSRSIDAVDGADWDEIARDACVFLQRRYLSAFESSSNGELGHRYALFSDSGRPVGLASFQIAEFVGPPIEPLLARKTAGVRWAARALRLTQRPLAFKMLVCGDAFSSGEHGFKFEAGVDPRRAAGSLAWTVRAIQKERAPYRLAGTLFKEFNGGQNPVAAELTDHRYSALDVEPNMVLALDPRWRKFQDYLDSLSSKYRVKAKRAYAKSEALVARDLSSADLTRLRERMEHLYGAVIERASYRLGRLPADALHALRDGLGDDLVLKGYFLGDELLGFMSGFICGDTLEAHLVGIDYERNHTHAIYPRMLYDYLQVGLERGLARVNYGRTAGEIKSTVGAEPVEMKCYIRHRRWSMNQLIPLVSRYVTMPDFPQRRPFKKSWYEHSTSH